MAGLAAAGPPDSGEPNSAAPLDSVTTVLPGASGASSASRVQWNTCATSTSQLRLNVCHVWCWIGRGSGVAPALSTSTPGWYLSISAQVTTGSAASTATGVNDSSSSARSSSSGARSRATPTTCAPARLRAVAMPRPKPRLAPVTSAVTPASSFSYITLLPGPMGSTPLVWRPADDLAFIGVSPFSFSLFLGPGRPGVVVCSAQRPLAECGNQRGEDQRGGQQE